MTTTPREWPNQCAHVRDDIAELVSYNIQQLEKVTTNQVNDEEAMEAIVAMAIHDLYLVHRSLEALGAATNPINELNRQVMQLTLNPGG